MKGVSAERIKELQSEIDREDYALFRPDRPTPPEVVQALGEPDRRLAEFVRVSRLGQGGIGEVWKAWDTRLGRWVAVKLPMATPDQEGATERFTREALAAARLSHPNIVSIHRVAEENGRCFIVMQYVEGQPLRRAQLEPKQGLEIVRDVALAVHYAHEQGVIHRDLKPANIVIGTDGRPFVLDFGLAHLEEAGRVQSREGLVAGTASYMSPEQARGEPSARERSTDIYSLGATLYEVATGRAPFEGATFAETLEKVLHREPEPPRSINPTLSRDVETVILKAMDKDPRRRYATAKELADDLDRCLRGEPVLARQGAMGQTIRRGIRKYPRPLLLATGVVLLSVMGLIMSAAYTVRAERHQREAKLTTMRNLAKVSLQAVLELRRAGANERIGEFLPQLDATYQETVASLPRAAEVDFLMGRIYRAVLADEKALEFQKRALEKDPDFLPALYERLVLSARKNVELLPDCEKILARGDESARRLAQGISAIQRGDANAARDTLRTAMDADPANEEIREMFVKSCLESVGPHSPVKIQEEAYRRSEEALTQGIGRDRGYVPYWMDRAKARAGLARLLSETGQDPTLDFQAADDDLTQAFKFAPSAQVLVDRAALRIRRGLHRMRLGENPLPDFDEADADLFQTLTLGKAQVQELPPYSSSALVVKSEGLRYRGDYRLLRGEGPLKELELLEKDAEQTRKVEPLAPQVWMNLALLWGDQALFRSGLGEDPTGDFKRVEESFDNAQAWSSVELQERRASLLVQRARVRTRVGKDSSEDLTAAEAILDHVITTAPFFSDALLTRALARRTRAEQRLKCAQDPSADFESALKDLTQVHEVNPVSAQASAERGHLELSWARHRTKVSDRVGALDHFGRAVRYFEEAVHVNELLAASLREPLREARRGLFAP